MIDRSHAEAVTYRIAFAALTFHVSKPEEEPGYSIDEDLDWSLEPVSELPPAEFGLLRDVAQATITDPTEHRDHLREVLESLTG